MMNGTVIVNDKLWWPTWSIFPGETEDKHLRITAMVTNFWAEIW